MPGLHLHTAHGQCPRRGQCATQLVRTARARQPHTRLERACGGGGLSFSFSSYYTPILPIYIYIYKSLTSLTFIQCTKMRKTGEEDMPLAPARRECVGYFGGWRMIACLVKKREGIMHKHLVTIYKDTLHSESMFLITLLVVPYTRSALSPSYHANTCETFPGRQPACACPQVGFSVGMAIHSATC